MARTGLSVTIAKKLKLTEFLLTSVTVTVRCCETADYNQAPTIIQKKSVILRFYMTPDRPPVNVPNTEMMAEI